MPWSPAYRPCVAETSEIRAPGRGAPHPPAAPSPSARSTTDDQMSAEPDPPSRPGHARAPRAPEPATLGARATGNDMVVKVFVVVPFLALCAAVPFAWGWGLSVLDAALAAVFYLVTLAGITVGYHRHLTHRSFRAVRAVRITLTALGSMALQGPVITWVADHRRHHAFTDKEGDPHSPWLFGTTPAAVARGFWHAHFGWLSATNAPTRPGSPPTCSPTATSPGSTGSSRCGRR